RRSDFYPFEVAYCPVETVVVNSLFESAVPDAVPGAHAVRPGFLGQVYAVLIDKEVHHEHVEVVVYELLVVGPYLVGFGDSLRFNQELHVIRRGFGGENLSYVVTFAERLPEDRERFISPVWVVGHDGNEVVEKGFFVAELRS